MNEEQQQTALVPIDEVLPELRAEQYAQVRAWDDARMALASGYEAADGEYLKKIRDALQEADGARTPLWKNYLDARGIAYETARNRIWKAEGHIATPRDKVNLTLSPVQAPVLPSPDTANIGTSPRLPTAPMPVNELPAWGHAPPMHPTRDLPDWGPRVTPEPYEPEPVDEYDDEDAPLIVAPYRPPALVPSPPTQPPLTMESAAKLIAEGRAMSPHAAGMPFSAALVTLSQTVWTVKDAAIEGWLDTSEANMWESAEYTLNGIIEWARHAQELLAARKRAGLRVVR